MSKIHVDGYGFIDIIISVKKKRTFFSYKTLHREGYVKFGDGRVLKAADIRNSELLSHVENNKHSTLKLYLKL